MGDLIVLLKLSFTKFNFNNKNILTFIIVSLYLNNI